jgi:hypothetical protein
MPGAALPQKHSAVGCLLQSTILGHRPQWQGSTYMLQAMLALKETNMGGWV